ncbi:MAG: hypothetical protein P1U32_09475, partial [Legionellaceae bacterium]|nr:hypothetical protein [Legionellaceae bacterium]
MQNTLDWERIKKTFNEIDANLEAITTIFDDPNHRNKPSFSEASRQVSELRGSARNLFATYVEHDTDGNQNTWLLNSEKDIAW